MTENKLSIDHSRTAVLIMDYQNGIVEMQPEAKQKEILMKSQKVLEASRKAGLRVIYVVIGFREGYPEVSPSGPFYERIKQSNRFAQGTNSSEIHPAVAPKKGDIIVTKHRVSSFSGSDLEMILRAGNFSTLVMFGIATSGVVLSTLRQASDLDYRIIVLKDCSADADDEVHSVLMDKVFKRQATVINSEEFIEAL